MIAHVMSYVRGLCRKHNQVLWTVVLLIAIFVMHHLERRQTTTEKTFCNYAMLMTSGFFDVCLIASSSKLIADGLRPIRST